MEWEQNRRKQEVKQVKKEWKEDTMKKRKQPHENEEEEGGE